MSKEQAKEFFYEVAKNKELAESVSQLMKESLGKEVAAERLISLAKNHGFNFTKEEAAIAQKDFKIPLSEKELADVSGGWGFSWLIAPVLSLFSAFLGGAEAQSQQSLDMNSAAVVQETSVTEQGRQNGGESNVVSSQAHKQESQPQQTASTVEKLQKQWSDVRKDLERYNKVLKEEVLPTGDTIFSSTEVKGFVSELATLIASDTENLDADGLCTLINRTKYVMHELLNLGIEARNTQEGTLNKRTKYVKLSAGVASEVELFKGTANLTIGSAVFSRAIWAHNLNEKIKPDLAAQKIKDQFGFTVDYKFDYEKGELLIEGTGGNCEFTADAYFKIMELIDATVTKVRIENVMNVDSGVFASNQNLKAVYLGEKVKTVKGFSGCKNIEWICYESEEIPYTEDDSLKQKMEITEEKFSSVSNTKTLDDFWKSL